jgi:Na+/H+-translocating membrane pyrophosphatase
MSELPYEVRTITDAGDAVLVGVVAEHVGVVMVILFHLLLVCLVILHALLLAIIGAFVALAVIGQATNIVTGLAVSLQATVLPVAVIAAGI